jgi:hypothetical protein
VDAFLGVSISPVNLAGGFSMQRPASLSPKNEILVGVTYTGYRLQVC